MSEAEHASSNAFMAITKIMRQRRRWGRGWDHRRNLPLPSVNLRPVAFFAGLVYRAGQTTSPAAEPSPRRDRLATSSTFATALSPTNLRAPRLNVGSARADRDFDDIFAYTASSFLALSFRTKIPKRSNDDDRFRTRGTRRQRGLLVAWCYLRTTSRSSTRSEVE